MLPLLAYAVLLASTRVSGWNVSLPLSTSGPLYVLSLSNGPANMSWVAVVDSGSSDTVLLSPGWHYPNQSQQAAGATSAVRGRGHSLFVDDALITWPDPSSATTQPRTLLSPLLLHAPPAAAIPPLNASVLLSPSLSASGGPPGLTSAWLASGSVFGVLGGAPRLASRTPFTALLPPQQPRCNASAACFAVMSLEPQCALNLTGMVPTPHCVSPSPVARFTLAGSVQEVLSAANVPQSRWALPPPLDTSQPATTLFQSAVFDLTLCGSRLLPAAHRVPAVFDSGAACLTLPAEAFRALMQQLGDKVQCPSLGEEWPAGTLDTGGQPLQCALSPSAPLQQLPRLQWSSGPAAGPVTVPLASLVYTPVNSTSQRRWLCVRRGVSVAQAAAAATPQLARVVLGSMLLRSQSFLLDYNTHTFALRSSLDSASSQEAAPPVGIVEQGGGDMSACLSRPACPVGTVADTASGVCKDLERSCDTYAYLQWDESGACTVRWGTVGAVLVLAVLLALADGLAQVHTHSMAWVAAALKSPSAAHVRGFPARLAGVLACLRRERPCAACLLRQWDRLAPLSLYTKTAEAATAEVPFERSAAEEAASYTLRRPSAAERGSFASE